MERSSRNSKIPHEQAHIAVLMRLVKFYYSRCSLDDIHVIMFKMAMFDNASHRNHPPLVLSNLAGDLCSVVLFRTHKRRARGYYIP
jgi:hypothetical protein